MAVGSAVVADAINGVDRAFFCDHATAPLGMRESGHQLVS